MELWRKYNKLIFFIIILALILALVMKNAEQNQTEEMSSEKDKRIATLEKEIQEQKNEIKDSEKDSEDTFDKDLKWFVTNVYESTDRYELFNKIKDSVSQEALVQLIGEELPTEPEPESDVVIKSVQSVNVYGKYVGEKKYQAVVLFDYEYKYKDTSQKIQKVVEIELKDQEGDWFVSDMKEIQYGDNYAS